LTDEKEWREKPNSRMRMMHTRRFNVRFWVSQSVIDGLAAGYYLAQSVAKRLIIVSQNDGLCG